MLASRKVGGKPRRCGCEACTSSEVRTLSWSSGAEGRVLGLTRRPGRVAALSSLAIYVAMAQAVLQKAALLLFVCEVSCVLIYLQGSEQRLGEHVNLVLEPSRLAIQTTTFTKQEDPTSRVYVLIGALGLFSIPSRKFEHISTEARVIAYADPKGRYVYGAARGFGPGIGR